MDLPPDDPNLSWSTLTRAAAGDRSAQSRFGRGYLPVVRTLLEVRWKGSPLAAEVDDAVQEVFLECLRPDGVLTRADRERGDLRGLLFGVTRNVALRHEERARRRMARNAPAGSALEAVPAGDLSQSVVVDREWARALTRLAGDRMRDRAQHGSAGARLRVELLGLRFREGLPIREIAAQWELEPSAVHRAYRKAREEFRQCLLEVVAEHVVRAEVDLDAEVDRVFDLLG
jgi:RNA polymerase sigma factor (sigma-70 family)